MSLTVDVALRRGDFSLSAEFESGNGITAFFGRSGSGKTTLTEIIAGLAKPDRGHVLLDGETLVDTAHGIAIPAHRRHIAVVFQDGRLFPHLTVRQNLKYGIWFNRIARPAWDRVVDMLDLGDCLDRRPRTLSGGEQRRVAIGRALLAEPRLLILDEPLSGLDTARKAEIIPYLERLRDELRRPIVFISHLIDEVIRLADHLVLIDAGRITTSGGLGEVLARMPAGPDRDEAGAVIDTLVSTIDAEAALATLTFGRNTLIVPAGGLSPGQKLRVHIRARDVALAIEKPMGISILNALAAETLSVGPASDGAVDILLGVGTERVVARITARSARTLGIEAGKPVFALVKSLAFARSSRLERSGIL